MVVSSKCERNCCKLAMAVAREASLASMLAIHGCSCLLLRRCCNVSCACSRVFSRNSAVAALVKVTMSNCSAVRPRSATWRTTNTVSEYVLPVPALASITTRPVSSCGSARLKGVSGLFIVFSIVFGRFATSCADNGGCAVEGIPHMFGIELGAPFRIFGGFHTEILVVGVGSFLAEDTVGI